jgi:hypothetical protein
MRGANSSAIAIGSLSTAAPIASAASTARSCATAVPHDLAPYIDRWLEFNRPELQLIAGGCCCGASKVIRDQTECRPQHACGKAIWPHLFRDCAVSELVDCAPEEIGIAPDLLGHADLQTTKRHYIQAVGMQAYAKVQEMIAARRRAATSGDSTGTSRVLTREWPV